MATIVHSFEDIVQQIDKAKPRFITIDGRDGTGKSHLSRQLHDKYGGTLIKEDDIREASLDDRFIAKIGVLKRLVAAGLEKGLVIFESCFMQEIMEHSKLKADVSIYIKTISSVGLWSDEDELAEEATKEEAIQKELNFGKQVSLQTGRTIGPTNFRLQMIAYHYDYKPHENTPILYERPEVYEEE